MFITILAVTIGPAFTVVARTFFIITAEKAVLEKNGVRM